MKVWIPHKRGLSHLSQVPEHVEVEVADDPRSLPSDPAGVDFFVPSFADQASLRDVVPLMRQLRVLQLPSAGSDGWLEVTPAGATICDARGVHDSSTSEWVLAAVLAHLRLFPEFQASQRAAVWNPRWSRELRGKRVLLIGAGSIGSAVARRLEPFDVELTRVARTARPGEGVHGVEDLSLLLPAAEVVILLVPLTAETRGMVDRAFLAAMDDGALLVNAARGPVVDTAALLPELASGRLRAALDVTDPEPLQPGDPLWHTSGVLITPHVAAFTDGMLDRVYTLVAEQLGRYLVGQPLRNRVVR